MRLATFNLLHGRSLTDGLVDPDRLAAAVTALDADVLALQEVDRDQSRSGNLDLTAIAARALHAPHHRFAAALVGTPGQGFRPSPATTTDTANPATASDSSAATPYATGASPD